MTERETSRGTVYRGAIGRVDSFHMRQKRPVTKLGADVEELMAAAGMKKNVDLAKVADVSESTVGRILHDEDAEFGRDILKRIAGALHVDVTRFERILAGGDPPPVAPKIEWVDPLVPELNRMLDPQSPLSDEEREDLRKFVDRMMDNHRVQMRRVRRSG